MCISDPTIVATTHLKPLVKWVGGKGTEISRFEKYIPHTFETYVEPFAGAASLYFHLNRHDKPNVLNDVHTELMDFYRAMKNGQAHEIVRFMDTHPNDEETYYNVRDRNTSTPTSLENAKRFYYLRRTCYRGMLRYSKRIGKFNVPFGRNKTCTYHKKLTNPAYTTLLRHTELLNTSFEHCFVERYNRPDTFCFLDPPYDTEFTDYGYCKFGKTHHIKLADCFKHTRMRCLMIIGDTPMTRALYAGYIVDEYPKQYRFKLHSGRVDQNTTHLVITNF